MIYTFESELRRADIHYRYRSRNYIRLVKFKSLAKLRKCCNTLFRTTAADILHYLGEMFAQMLLMLNLHARNNHFNNYIKIDFRVHDPK